MPRIAALLALALLASCANTGAALGELGASLAALSEVVEDQDATLEQVTGAVDTAIGQVETLGAKVAKDGEGLINGVNDEGEDAIKLSLAGAALWYLRNRTRKKDIAEVTEA